MDRTWQEFSIKATLILYSNIANQVAETIYGKPAEQIRWVFDDNWSIIIVSSP